VTLRKLAPGTVKTKGIDVHYAQGGSARTVWIGFGVGFTGSN
jgi:hypothetical protein